MHDDRDEQVEEDGAQVLEPVGVVGHLEDAVDDLWCAHIVMDRDEHVRDGRSYLQTTETFRYVAHSHRQEPICHLTWTISPITKTIAMQETISAWF